MSCSLAEGRVLCRRMHVHPHAIRTETTYTHLTVVFSERHYLRLSFAVGLYPR